MSMRLGTLSFVVDVFVEQTGGLVAVGYVRAGAMHSMPSCWTGAQIAIMIPSACHAIVKPWS